MHLTCAFCPAFADWLLIPQNGESAVVCADHVIPTLAADDSTTVWPIRTALAMNLVPRPEWPPLSQRTAEIARLMQAGWRLWHECHRSYPTGWNLYPPDTHTGLRTVRPLDVLRLRERALIHRVTKTTLSGTFTWWEWGTGPDRQIRE